MKRRDIYIIIHIWFIFARQNKKHKLYESINNENPANKTHKLYIGKKENHNNTTKYSQREKKGVDD